MENIKDAFIVLAVGLMALARVANAASIGINLGTDRGGSSLGSTDSAGVVGQINWNNLSGNSGSSSSLKDNGGTSTTVNVSWSSPNTWHCNTANNTPNDRLMYGYIDLTYDNVYNPAVNLSGIPLFQLRRLRLLGNRHFL